MQQTKVGKFRYVSTKGHVSVSKQQTEIRRINHYPADGVVCLGHVYFVHPSTDAPVDVSTDISVDISTDTRPISVDISTDISTEIRQSISRSICQPMFV